MPAADLLAKARAAADRAWGFAASGELIDRAILPFAPGIAKARFEARATYEFMASPAGRAFTAARHKALAGWRTGNSSPNLDTVYDLPTLRERSHDLDRNDCIARGAIDQIVTRSIGTGLSLQPHIDREFLGLGDDEAEAWEDDTRRQFEVWAESDEASADRCGNFYQKQAQVRYAAATGGDVIALLPSIPRWGTDITLAIQLVEAERVSNPHGQPETMRFCGGFEFDDYGAPLRAHICNQYPSDLLNPSLKDWTAIDVFGTTGRRNVLQIFGKMWTLRPGQARGVPLLAPAIFPLKQLKDFTEAELQSTVQAAIHTYFIEMEAEAFGQVFGSGMFGDASEKEKTDYMRSLIWNGEIEGGKAVRLMPGEKAHNVQANHPNAGLDPFMAAILKRVGASLGIPFEVLILSFNASYSASRAALLAAWQQFMLFRYGDATCFCQPVYEAFLEESIALGKIRAPGFRASKAFRAAWSGAQWIGDGPGSIDPNREVQAAAGRVALGISTRDQESIAYDGQPVAPKLRQLGKEKRLMEGAGIAPTPPNGAAPTDPNAALINIMGTLADIQARLDRIEEAT